MDNEAEIKKLAQQWEMGVIPKDGDLREIRDFMREIAAWLEVTGDSKLLLGKMLTDISLANRMLEDRERP